jgi:hypothetical protein
MMSALEFSKQLAAMTTCEGAECIKKGRRRMYLAGYPVPSEQKYGLKTGLMLCNRCAKEATRIYEGALAA